ncbi:hypothetical protein ACKKBG_A16860 [Auxenochlorella protothecoides x Auxenochlorella symbiontica]
MNQGETQSNRARETEVKLLGGLDAYRRHALANLRLKTVIKESHGGAVTGLACCSATPGAGNLVASIGSNHATVYDGTHLADHVSVAVQFVNSATAHTPGGNLRAATWLHPMPETTEPGCHGNARLAIAGDDAAVSIISMAEARVTTLLQGHVAAVTDLAANPSQPGALAALSSDGSVALWDLGSERQRGPCSTSHAASLAWSPDGECLLVGTRRGKLWKLSPSGSADIAWDKTELPLPSKAGFQSAALDCLRPLQGGRLAIKAADGRMAVLSWPSLEPVATWRVPDGTYPGSGLAATPDGNYIAVGNMLGRSFVHCTATGKCLAAVEPVRLHEPVTSVALSSDCRHLWVALGLGFIFRYEYLGALEDDKENSANVEEDTNRSQAL